MTGDRQAEGAFGFVAGQATGRVNHLVQIGSLRQIVRFGGGPSSDGFQLIPVWKLMFQDHKQLLQLDGNLHDGREHQQKGPVLFAGGDLTDECLHNFGRVQEPVKVVQHEQSRPLGVGQSAHRANGRQRIGARCVGLLAGD